MPRQPKKRSTKVTTKEVPMPPIYEPPQTSNSKKTFPWRLLVGILLLALIGLLSLNKGLIVAAMVNGKPIFSWELNKSLRARFGEQTLEGMIGEKLIEDEANKAGVSVSKEDIDAKQAEVLGNLGPNVKLEDLLKFQGMTKEDFENQLKLQLTVERLLTKDLTISDNDVTNYVATNQATLTATDPAKMREEAKAAIKSNFVSEKLQTWFAEIRQKANVAKFL